MQFNNRLPKGSQGVEDYRILAPLGGLSDKINELLRGNVRHLDLSITRDLTDYTIRIVLRADELIQDSSTVFLIQGALGVLLDQAGETSGDVVVVTGSLTTEVVSQDMTAGSLTIWKPTRKLGIA